MAGNNHLLQKVTFEIGLASQEGAFEIQNRISNAFQSGVIRELEKLFDRHVAADKVVKIEKIEIDLGNLASSRLEEEFIAGIEKEMEQLLVVLREEIRQQDPASPNAQRINIRLPQKNNVHFEVDVSITHEHVSHFEKVAHLLEYGVLPVSSSTGQQTRLSELIVIVLSEEPERFAGFLKQRGADKQILQRVALNLTEPQLQYIAALLGCPFSYELPEIIAAFTAHCTKEQITPLDFTSDNFSFFQTNLARLTWFRILSFYASTKKRNTLSSTEKVSGKIELFVHLALAEPVVLKKLLIAESVPAKGKNIQAIPEVISKILQAIRTELKMEKPSPVSPVRKSRSTKKSVAEDAPVSQPEKTSSAVEAEKAIEKVIRTNPQVQQTQSSTPSSDFSKTTQTEDPPEAETGIYVRNAGLVILHPYLRTFFTNLNLVEGKTFKSPEAAWKAVHLLQHATGFLPEEEQEGWSEHDLVLNKILCGLDIAEPVPEIWPLTDEEKTEATELLQAVISNWTIMQRSSVHALQTTFLQKQGRLKKLGNDWDLLIERDSAVEILIDKLPWGISMVKLPWNDFMIHTQW